MGFIITTAVFCDGKDCDALDFDGQVERGSVMRRKAWEAAYKAGWRKVEGKHLCPVCLEKRARRLMEEAKEEYPNLEVWRDDPIKSSQSHEWIATEAKGYPET